MATIVLIHGIGQQHSTAAEQEAEWVPCLVKGVLRGEHPQASIVAARLAGSIMAGRSPVVRMAFYGDLFLPTGIQGVDEAVSPTAEVLAEVLAEALLKRAGSSSDPRLSAEALNALRQADPGIEAVQGLGGRARGAMEVLDRNAWLAGRIFGVMQNAKKNLRQVTLYLTQDDVRTAVQARVAELLDDDTRMLIGHSLGSVVAWEASQTLTRPLPVLVTLGSPLGLDSVVYLRLRPQPPTWPTSVHRWVNVAHPDDVVAVEPDLGPLFPGRHGQNIETHTPGSTFPHHAAAGYLEEKATGRAIADAIGGEAEASQ